MNVFETPGLGVAQKKKLAELLAEIRGFNPSVSLDDFEGQYAFALTVHDLVVRLQALVGNILPFETELQLQSIVVDVHDLASASGARAALDALVPAVEDALAAINSQPGTLLPGALEQLLQERGLDTVSEEVERALHATESDPPVAITAARAALESLLKVYLEDKQLADPTRLKTGKLLKTAMGDLGLDPSDTTDADVRDVLQGLWSVVHGIASLRTHAGSAHGYGRRAYRLQARHARLAIQASQTFVEFFIETWNYQERRPTSD